MKKFLFLLFIGPMAFAQTLAPLTVEKIMRDPKWIGVAPSNLTWSEDSKQIYFQWNPENNPGDSLYVVSLTNRTPQKVTASIRRSLPNASGVYNKAFTRKLFEKNGDLFLLDLVSNKTTQITNTLDRESSAAFSFDESKVLFTANGNLYSWQIQTGTFAQLTDFRKGSKKPEAKLTEQEKWLKKDQLAYFEILKQRSDNQKSYRKKPEGRSTRSPKRNLSRRKEC
ncbi:MAG: hypothetical protein U5K54_14240 [Cytophagales bacterium]|nr:hypothetical protein [Cytophagales bacterium]